MERTLIITVTHSWMSLIRTSAKRAESDVYQGDCLNFETMGGFFNHITERRLALIQALLSSDGHAMSLTELALRVGGEVSCARDDVQALVDLGIVERRHQDEVSCPFSCVQIDLSLRAK